MESTPRAPVADGGYGRHGVVVCRQAVPSNNETTVTDIAITRTANPKQPPADETLTFGNVFTDHMFLMNYEEGKGWHNPRIVALRLVQPGSRRPACCTTVRRFLTD